MPMSPHRPALAGILLAVVALFGLVTSSGDATAGSPSVSERLTSTALKYEGTYGGQCWGWMQRVVYEATGALIGFDYREGFFEAGAVEVQGKDARAGDIIQIADDRNTEPDADYPGLHTVMVLQNLGNGTFEVIDSNWLWDGMVRRHSGYSPSESAARNGLNYRVYRFTGATSPATPPAGAPATPAAPSAGPLQPGDTAKVNAHGDPPCLNLRWAPGVGNNPIGCLPHGSLVKVLSAASDPIDGHRWIKVLVNGNQFFVAAEFLDRFSTPGVPASSAAPGGPQPVLPFRTFVAMVSSTD